MKTYPDIYKSLNLNPLETKAQFRVRVAKVYAQQFIDKANEIIDPAIVILPETYNKEIDNWIKIQDLQDE